MPQIPTSRDVAYVNPRSGRIAPSGPTVSVGAAVANMGEALTRVAYDLNDLRTMEAGEQQKKRGYDLETRLTEFRANEEELFNKARDESSESGIGFTRQFIEGHQKRADEFIKSNFGGISEAQNANGRQTLLGLGNSLYSKANSYEQQAKTNFYDRTTNSGLDKIRTQIRNNAAPYEELKRQGLASIDAADMPEPWKAERRALWDADAAESKWRWKFEQDPQSAIDSMRGGGRPVKKAELNSSVRDRGSYAVQFYEKLGYTREQAAGIVGNLIQESNLQSSGAVGDNGTAFGVAQWRGERLSELKRFAASRGKSWEDFDTQLAFVDVELQNRERSAYSKLKSAKTVDDATAAFIGFERPKGWTEANPRGGHGYSNRLGNAAAFVDGDVATSWTPDPDVESIPYDRREQLANWGETEYNQQRTQQRASAKDAYSLLIATEPQNISQSVILNDPALDNGDKATLINSLRTAMKERGSTDAFIGALAQGNISVNAADPDQTKIADSAYERLLGAVQTPEGQKTVTSDFVARTGYIPKKLQAELRRGAGGTDPGLMAQSMEAAMVLSKNAPFSFENFDGSDGVRKKMDLYRAYTQDMGYSPDEAARRLIDANDPEKAARRDALLKTDTVKKQLKDIDASMVSGIFDKGTFSFAP